MDNLTKFFYDINNDLKKTISTVDTNHFFMEDTYLKRYNRKAIVMKIGQDSTQKGGDYKYISNSLGFSNFMKQIEKYDSVIFRKLRSIEFKKKDSGLYDNILKYVLKRFTININDYEYFTLKDQIGKQSFNLDKKGYINELPTTFVSDNICIAIQLVYSDYIKNINNVCEYIKTLLNNYLETHGNCLLYMPIVFNIEQFYNLFKEIGSMFKNVTLYYPTNFQKMDANGFIILNNKLVIKKDPEITIDKKIIKFNKRYTDHILSEYEMMNKLLDIRQSNNIAYEIMYNKLLSISLLQYYL